MGGIWRVGDRFEYGEGILDVGPIGKMADVR